MERAERIIVYIMNLQIYGLQSNSSSVRSTNSKKNKTFVCNTTS